MISDPSALVEIEETHHRYLNNKHNVTSLQAHPTNLEGSQNRKERYSHISFSPNPDPLSQPLDILD